MLSLYQYRQTHPFNIPEAAQGARVAEGYIFKALLGQPIPREEAEKIKNYFKEEDIEIVIIPEADISRVYRLNYTVGDTPRQQLFMATNKEYVAVLLYFKKYIQGAIQTVEKLYVQNNVLVSEQIWPKAE